MLLTDPPAVYYNFLAQLHSSYRLGNLCLLSDLENTPVQIGLSTPCHAFYIGQVRVSSERDTYQSLPEYMERLSSYLFNSNACHSCLFWSNQVFEMSPYY